MKEVLHYLDAPLHSELLKLRTENELFNRELERQQELYRLLYSEYLNLIDYKNHQLHTSHHTTTIHTQIPIPSSRILSPSPLATTSFNFTPSQNQTSDFNSTFPAPSQTVKSLTEPHHPSKPSKHTNISIENTDNKSQRHSSITSPAHSPPIRPRSQTHHSNALRHPPNQHININHTQIVHPTNRPLSKTNVFSPPSGVNRNICNTNSFNGKSGNSGNALSKCGERDGASFNKRSASSAGNSYRASNKRPESVLSSGALYPANSPASEECMQRKVRFGVQNVEGFEGKKLDRSFRKSYGSVMSSAGGLSQSVHIRGGKERDKPIRCATSSGKRTANNLHRKKWVATEAPSFL